MKLKLRKSYAVIVLSMFFASCLTNVEEPFEEETAVDPCASITYSLNVKPIIDNNCVSCHAAGGNFPNLTTYDRISANASQIKAEVVARTMPQGTTLTENEIKAISCWVDAGALNN